MRSKPNVAYIASGISADAIMGEDFIIECVKNPKNSTVEIFTSKTSSSKLFSHRKVGKAQIKLLNASIIDNRIYCRVEHDSEFDFQNLTINLRKEKYFLMIAVGKTVKIGEIGQHEDRACSKNEIDFNEGGNVEEKGKFWIQVHGSLMIFSWIGLMSVGSLIGRFFRKSWKGKTLFDKDYWFSVSFY